MPTTTLEQWRMLHAVVHYGGFAQASKAIHKSQSSINHAVHKLQRQLGLPLLEVIGRKAQLTEAGSLMLRQARQLLDQAEQLEQVAASLSRGQESEVRIAVDEVYPYPCLANALHALALEYPDTRVELMETILSGGNEKLLAGEADLLISASTPTGFLGEPILQVEFTAVAHPQHPLHQLNRPIGLGDLKQHRQIVVRDSGRERRIDAGWLGAEQRWTVSHLRTSVDMICRGLGFAWLPENQIGEHRTADLLRTLPLEQGRQRRSELYLSYAGRERAGPVTCRLAELLLEQAQGQTSAP